MLRIVTTLVLVGLCIGLLAGVAAQGDGPYAPDPHCPTDAYWQAVTPTLLAFKDTLQIALATPRNSLASLLVELRRIYREVESIQADTCAEQTRVFLLAGIDDTINALTTFLGDAESNYSVSFGSAAFSFSRAGLLAPADANPELILFLADLISLIAQGEPNPFVATQAAIFWRTGTFTYTPTNTPRPTRTASPTRTPTPTPMFSPTATATPITPSPTVTASITPFPTPSIICRHTDRSASVTWARAAIRMLEWAGDEPVSLQIAWRSIVEDPAPTCMEPLQRAFGEAINLLSEALITNDDVGLEQAVATYREVALRIRAVYDPNVVQPTPVNMATLPSMQLQPTEAHTASNSPNTANAQVVITRVIRPENIMVEGVEIRNKGPVIDLSGWTMRDGEGNVYIFPAERRLFQGTSLTIFTGVGDDTPIALYWDRQQAAFSPGEMVMLTDRSGRVQSVFTVP